MAKKKKKENIVHMYNCGGSNATVAPSDLLKIIAEDIDKGELKCNRVVILTVQVDGDDFEVTPYASNLRHSEAISVLEVAKTIILKMMRYIP